MHRNREAKTGGRGVKTVVMYRRHRSVLLLEMRTDTLRASTMNLAGIAYWHVLKISMVLTGPSGE